MSRLNARYVKTLPLTVIAAMALGGCATSKQVESNETQLNLLSQQVTVLTQQVSLLDARTNALLKAPKRAPGCVLGGQDYSPGSVVAGRICERISMIVKPGQPPEYGWEEHFRR